MRKKPRTNYNMQIKITKGKNYSGFAQLWRLILWFIFSSGFFYSMKKLKNRTSYVCQLAKEHCNTCFEGRAQEEKQTDRNKNKMRNKRLKNKKKKIEAIIK